MFKVGHLEVICGSMYCGKSEELIRRMKRVAIANKKSQLFRPSSDNRYSVDGSMDVIVTHDKSSLKAELVSDSMHLLSLVNLDTEVVGIDEIQFFDDKIIDVISQLNSQGKRVIVAGLDMYSSGEVFGPIGILLAKAKYISKLHAVCSDCGEDAYLSYNLGNVENNNTSQIDVGSFGKYLALCQTCVAKREHNKLQS